jgi:hypothetical protein
MGKIDSWATDGVQLGIDANDSNYRAADSGQSY